jgi:hypothetical protein
MLKKLTCLVTLALLAGCGSSASSDGGGTPPGTPATAADFTTQFDSVGCQWQVKCGYIGASEATQCAADAAAASTKYPSGYDSVEAATAKRVTYDADAAKACLDAAKALGCTIDQEFDLSRVCAGVYKPAVAVGGACKADSECVNGYCNQGAGVMTDGCAGTCAAFVATGATCDPNDPRCGTTDYCDSTTNKCTARAASGASCGGSLPECQSSLFCKGYVAGSGSTPDTPGKCAAAGKEGDACESFFFGNTDCTPGLYCDSSAASPTCKARLASGSDCDTSMACQDGLACIGLQVDSSTGNVTTKGKCGAYLDVNKTCADAYETGCPYDTTCDKTALQCAPYGAAGQDCSSNGTQGWCNGNFYCDETSQKCTAMVALGATCTPPSSNGTDPCQAGSCDATSKTCALVCK